MNTPLTHPVTGLPQVRALAPGEVITEPGIYADVSMDRYHGPDLCAGPSVSSSGLRTLFSQSPAHYFATSPLNPNRVEPAEKEAFILGRAAHHLLLGEADFAKHFVVRPDEAPDGRAWNGNNNTCKAWLKEAADAGLTVLTPTMVEQIKGMSESLAANTLVQAGILNGAIEQTLAWQDEDTGIWCKARPDAMPLDCNDVSDLKTTRGTLYPDLQRSVADRDYGMQGALISMGMRAILKREMATFSLVFVEKTPPYCCRVVTLKPDDIALGEDQIRASLKIFKRCLETGEWPGPGGVQRDAEYLDLPDWYRNRVKDRLTLIEEEFAS